MHSNFQRVILTPKEEIKILGCVYTILTKYDFCSVLVHFLFKLSKSNSPSVYRIFFWAGQLVDLQGVTSLTRGTRRLKPSRFPWQQALAG